MLWIFPCELWPLLMPPPAAVGPPLLLLLLPDSVSWCPAVVSSPLKRTVLLEATLVAAVAVPVEPSFWVSALPIRVLEAAGEA